MSSTASTVTRGHPITVAAAECEDLIESVRETSTWSMTDEETRSTLARLTRIAARVAELELRVAAHAETNGVGDATGATSSAAWWATETRQTTTETHRKVKVASALDTDLHAPVRAALATGEVLVDQATAILRAIDALPADLDPEIVARAQDHLLDQARVFDARALRVLGKRIFEVIDPETAEAHEAKLLEREEQAASAAVSVRMADDGHGRTRGVFTIPALHGAMLKKALLAYAAPKHRAAVDGAAPLPGRPSDKRLGEALCELIERCPVDRLPKTGGVNATVVVTVPLASLRNDLGVAQLDTGERISTTAARRLACEAGILPAVLGGKGQILDLGRTKRFHNEAQRIVAGIEQKGRWVGGCDSPPGMCHMHHPTPWSQGGATNRDAVLLCPRHHAHAHDARYQLTHTPTGTIHFHRRT